MGTVDTEVPEDCTTCGACCFSESPRHARVTGDDYERLGQAAEALVEFLGNQAFMRIVPAIDPTIDAGDVDGRGHESVGPGGAPAERRATFRKCVALVLDAEAGTFLCSVYERRPEVCRALEQAGPACLGELHAKHDRPRRSLAVLRDTKR
jgi:Fe-S-cluster containining protein